MKKTALILAALLFLTTLGCSKQTQPPQTDYVLYFPPAANVSHGSALVAQPWERESEEPPGVEEMLNALLEGPQQEGLTSPFPKGVRLLRMERDTQEPDKLVVRFSEEYSSLSNLALTLADYSVVLTLSQLEEVEGIEIVSSSYSASYRSRWTMRAEDAELMDPLLAERTAP